jgi:hypothetical protein
MAVTDGSLEIKGTKHCHGKVNRSKGEVALTRQASSLV